MRKIDNTKNVKSLNGIDDWTLNKETMLPGKLLEVIIFTYHNYINTQMGDPVVGPEDTYHGFRIVPMLNDAVIELEDADYDWLRNITKIYAPRILGINGEIAIKIFKDCDKEYEIKNNKKENK